MLNTQNNGIYACTLQSSFKKKKIEKNILSLDLASNFKDMQGKGFGLVIFSMW